MKTLNWWAVGEASYDAHAVNCKHPVAVDMYVCVCMYMYTACIIYKINVCVYTVRAVMQQRVLQECVHTIGHFAFKSSLSCILKYALV